MKKSLPLLTALAFLASCATVIKQNQRPIIYPPLPITRIFKTQIVTTNKLEQIHVGSGLPRVYALDFRYQTSLYPPDYTWYLIGSTNLKNWYTICQFTNDPLRLYMKDINKPYEFYRAMGVHK